MFCHFGDESFQSVTGTVILRS